MQVSTLALALVWSVILVWSPLGACSTGSCHVCTHTNKATPSDTHTKTTPTPVHAYKHTPSHTLLTQPLFKHRRVFVYCTVLYTCKCMCKCMCKTTGCVRLACGSCWFDRRVCVCMCVCFWFMCLSVSADPFQPGDGDPPPRDQGPHLPAPQREDAREAAQLDVGEDSQGHNNLPHSHTLGPWPNSPPSPRFEP